MNLKKAIEELNKQPQSFWDEISEKIAIESKKEAYEERFKRTAIPKGIYY